MKRQIFIFGYYGRKNIGDDAMVYALIQEFHILYPAATFAILSQISITVPPETKNLVKFVRPIPRIVFREIMHSSIFIMGGGTQIYDYGEGTKRLKIISEMFIMLIWAKLFCKRIYLISIGVEPFLTTWGRFLSKRMCRLADFISVRDSSSYKILEGMGLKNRVTLSFDLSALLPSLLANDSSLIKKTDLKILGISILPFFETYQGDKEKDLLFVHEIAKGLNQWLKRDRQSLIYLFVFKGKLKVDDVLITEMILKQKRVNNEIFRCGHIDDVLITELLRKQLEPSERVEFVPYNPDPIEAMSKVAQCHAFVGMRYHSCVFAYLTNAPLLIINYFQKCQALAEDVGLPKHAVISLEEILNGEFEMYLKSMQEHPDDFVATLPIDIAKQKAKNGLPKKE